jgi:hypothetical protein
LAADSASKLPPEDEPGLGVARTSWTAPGARVTLYVPPMVPRLVPDHRSVAVAVPGIPAVLRSTVSVWLAVSV